MLKASVDGRNWATIVDKSDNERDVPHDYIELPAPVDARYVRIENLHVPTGKFALSGLRVFGNAHGAKPRPVERFVALRAAPPLPLGEGRGEGRSEKSAGPRSVPLALPVLSPAQAKPVGPAVPSRLAVADRRNAWLKWQLSSDATGYVIYAGVAPDKLYTSVMVYGASEYYFRAMDKSRPYYFQIEAFNESGISERSAPIKAE